MLAAARIVAAVCLTRAWAADPSLTARAAQEFAAGDKEAACADATAALQKDPSDAKALGLSRLTCGEKPISKRSYKKLPSRQLKTETPPAAGEALPSEVIGAGPTGPGLVEGPSSYDKLQEAQSFLAQNKPAEAAEAARRAIELQPLNRRAYDALAEADRRLRNYTEVLYVVETGLRSFPNDIDLLKNKIFCLNKAKDWKAALQTCDQALAVDTTDPVLYALKAFALGSSGEREGMLKALATASALDPSFEPLQTAAQKAAAGQEPFLMPGDSPQPIQKKSPLKSQRTRGLMILGGLIALFILIVSLLGVKLFAKHQGDSP